MNRIEMRTAIRAVVICAGLGMASCENNESSGPVAPVICPTEEEMACFRKMSEATDALPRCWKHEGTCPESVSGCGILQADRNTCVWPDGAKLTGYSQPELELILSDGTACYKSRFVSTSEHRITLGSQSFRYLFEGDIRAGGAFTIECDDGSKSGPFTTSQLTQCAAAAAGTAGSKTTTQAPSSREIWCCSTTTPPSCPQPIKIAPPVASSPTETSSPNAGGTSASEVPGSVGLFERMMGLLR